MSYHSMHHSHGSRSHSERVIRVSLNFNPGFTLEIAYVGHPDALSSAVLTIEDKLSGQLERYEEYMLKSNDTARAKMFVQQNDLEIKQLFQMKLLKRIEVNAGRISVFHPTVAGTPQKSDIIQSLEFLSDIVTKG